MARHRDSDHSDDFIGRQPTQGPDVAEGDLLAERFRLLRPLGRGGMGLVFLARDETLQTDVAVKLLPPLLAGDARAVARFRHEVLLARQLTHPHICRVHDFYEDGARVFLVMEYIEGETLADRLARQPEGRLPLEATLEVLSPVAEALDYAHRHHILHRDVKPANIMIATDGTVRLLDFGIARHLRDALTRLTGAVTPGTLVYMSPEQLMGEEERIGPGSDIYSLAATAYECLTGEPPFTSGDIGRQICSRAPRPIGGVPAEVSAAVLQGLAKAPEERYRSAAEAIAALRPRPAPSGQPDVGAPKENDDLSLGWCIGWLIGGAIVGGIGGGIGSAIGGSIDRGIGGCIGWLIGGVIGVGIVGGIGVGIGAVIGAVIGGVIGGGIGCAVAEEVERRRRR